MLITNTTSFIVSTMAANSQGSEWGLLLLSEHQGTACRKRLHTEGCPYCLTGPPLFDDHRAALHNCVGVTVGMTNLHHGDLARHHSHMSVTQREYKLERTVVTFT